MSLMRGLGACCEVCAGAIIQICARQSRRSRKSALIYKRKIQKMQLLSKKLVVKREFQ
jgi:hypothetical protein